MAENVNWKYQEFIFTICYEKLFVIWTKVEKILEQRVDYFSPPSIFVKIQIKGAKITLQS